MTKDYRTFQCKDKEIIVKSEPLNIDQTNAVLLKVIEQAIKDCCILYGTKRFDGNSVWLTAYDFIFDDEYLVEWGEILISPAEMMSLLGFDIAYMRQMVIAKMLEKLE